MPSVLIFMPQPDNGTYEREVQRMLEITCIPQGYSFSPSAAVWIRGTPGQPVFAGMVYYSNIGREGHGFCDNRLTVSMLHILQQLMEHMGSPL